MNAEEFDDWQGKIHKEIYIKYKLDPDHLYHNSIAKLREIVLDIKTESSDPYSHFLWAIALDIINRIEEERLRDIR